MRGFSIIEVVTATALATTGIVTVTLITVGAPAMLEDARLEHTAIGIADALLTESELRAREDFTSIASSATTTHNNFSSSLKVDYLDEYLAARITAAVTWRTARGKEAYIALHSVVSAPEAALDEPCSPFIGTDIQPISTRTLSSADLLPGMGGIYPIASLAATRDALAVAAASTSSTTDPALFIFELDDNGALREVSTRFDNASTSRVGFAALAQGGGYLYAASAFGSASQATCSASACDQLHIFSLSSYGHVSSLRLNTSQPPYAVSANGVSTPVKSITYRNGYVYMGLEKTVAGYEFNIIDVRDPANPKWLSGLPIGRSVNAIAISGHMAYLATSDSSRELIAVDIEHRETPRVRHFWDAPGAANFGLGSAVTARPGALYFGRTYTPNASEWFVLDTARPNVLLPVREENVGTSERPESVRGLLSRGSAVMSLSGKRLESKSSDAYVVLSEQGLTTAGSALTCRGQTLYAGAGDRIYTFALP